VRKVVAPARSNRPIFFFFFFPLSTSLELNYPHLPSPLPFKIFIAPTWIVKIIDIYRLKIGKLNRFVFKSHAAFDRTYDLQGNAKVENQSFSILSQTKITLPLLLFSAKT